MGGFDGGRWNLCRVKKFIYWPAMDETYGRETLKDGVFQMLACPVVKGARVCSTSMEAPKIEKNDNCRGAAFGWAVLAGLHGPLSGRPAVGAVSAAGVGAIANTRNDRRRSGVRQPPSALWAGLTSSVALPTVPVSASIAVRTARSSTTAAPAHTKVGSYLHC